MNTQLIKHPEKLSVPMMPRLMYGPILDLRSDEEEVLNFLLPLSEDYPSIENWFRSKVVPGLRKRERYIHRVERDGQLIGVGIAKKGLTEKKICTVRVLPEHFGRGAGVRIFDSLLRWLDDDRPHLTVSEGKLPAFERLFDHYGFSETWQRDGLYVPGRFELGFNENAQPSDESGTKQGSSGQAGE
ncbi:GNAT family N-acetyltransferase [Rhizobium leguminosarum]|uniref:GNAT family N-acetyltransferase n=1 Tax=Rhizobium leguminosarum TaxID=384 RepID=UPI0013BD597F|nr:GNAT family N-acetyltransferase [Rhizobium leguminosarum]MBY5385216.1 GNAT family N-acetyltransferase [Rhizobium leguminosarum]NEH73974.1 N-acetyltransferase [Rhizobium leguminosarum]